MLSYIFLFILTILWLIVSVIMCLNIDLIRKEEGSNSTLFGMTFFMVIFSFYCLFIYAFDVVKHEEGLQVEFLASIPFHKTVTILVSMLLIVMSSWSIYNYGKKYEDDHTIPRWRKMLFKWGNAAILILACLELGLRRGHPQVVRIGASVNTWWTERKQKQKQNQNQNQKNIENQSGSDIEMVSMKRNPNNP